MPGFSEKQIFRNIRKWWLVYASLLFIVYMAFFDENNFMARMRYSREIDFLEEQKRAYTERISADSTEIEKMKHDSREIEKIAREMYGMKSPDEDIYIIIRNDDGE